MYVHDNLLRFTDTSFLFFVASKRTLGTFFSKVKAKIQELDSPAEEYVVSLTNKHVFTRLLRRTTPPRRVAASPPQPSYQPYQAAPDPAISAGYESYSTFFLLMKIMP